MAATQVAAGIRHSCALGLRLDLTAGQFVPDVGCWGASATGATALLPKPVLDGMPTQIAAGNDTTCVVTTTGAVQCWAATTDAAALNDYTVTGLGTVVDLAVGGSRACAVNVAGGVSCWNKDKGKPVSSLSGTPTFSQVDAFGGVACGTTTTGGDTVCANKRATGEVVCWGAISRTFFGLPE